MSPNNARAVWVFDFDGKLSPAVSDPTTPPLHPDCRELLIDLVAGPASGVVFLSRRRLGDLVARVSVPDVLLGGESGMDWRMGDGSTQYQHGRLEESMLRARREAAPLLERAGGLPGVHLEKRRWSATVRYRNCERASLPQLRRVLKDLAGNARLEIFRGTAVAEVRFMPGTGKAYGLRRLCRLRRWDPSKLKLIYAGDDARDVTGMHWTLSRGGIVFDVGGRTGVSEARVVSDAPALAAAMRELARREF